MTLRVMAKVDEGDELVFGSDCAGEFSGPSLFGVDRNVRFTEGAVDHLGRVAAGLAPPARL